MHKICPKCDVSVAFPVLPKCDVSVAFPVLPADSSASAASAVDRPSWPRRGRSPRTSMPPVAGKPPLQAPQRWHRPRFHSMASAAWLRAHSCKQQGTLQGTGHWWRVQVASRVWQGCGMTFAAPPPCVCARGQRSSSRQVRRRPLYSLYTLVCFDVCAREPLAAPVLLFPTHARLSAALPCGDAASPEPLVTPPELTTSAPLPSSSPYTPHGKAGSPRQHTRNGRPRNLAGAPSGLR